MPVPDISPRTLRDWIAGILAAAPALEWLHLLRMGASLAELVDRHPTLRVSVVAAPREAKAVALLASGRVVRRRRDRH